MTLNLAGLRSRLEVAERACYALVGLTTTELKALLGVVEAFAPDDHVLAESMRKRLDHGSVAVSLYVSPNLPDGDGPTKLMLEQVRALREFADGLEKIARGN